MTADRCHPVPIREVLRLRLGHIGSRARWPLLAVAGASAGIAGRSGQQPPLLLGLLVLGALMTSAWLQLLNAGRSARDREADARLQVLTDRACLARVELLAVHGTAWSSIGGQHALIIDLATGQPECVWFSQADFPPGTFVLVDRGHDVVRPLDWMLPDEVAAAYRHRRRNRRRPAYATRMRERRAVTRLIKSARESGVGPLMSG